MKGTIKKTIKGFLFTGFIWCLLMGGITLLLSINQCTGYGAVLTFVVAVLGLILSISHMYSIGDDMDIASKARKHINAGKDVK